MSPRSFELIRWTVSAKAPVRLNYSGTNLVHLYAISRRCALDSTRNIAKVSSLRSDADLDIEGVGRDDIIEVGYNTLVSTLSSTHKSAGSPTTRKLPSGW